MLPDHLGSQDVIQLKLNSGVRADCFAGRLSLEGLPILLAGSNRGGRGHLLFCVRHSWLRLCRVIPRQGNAPTAAQVCALWYSTVIIEATSKAYSAIAD